MKFIQPPKLPLLHWPTCGPNGLKGLNTVHNTPFKHFKKRQEIFCQLFNDSSFSMVSNITALFLIINDRFRRRKKCQRKMS